MTLMELRRMRVAAPADELRLNGVVEVSRGAGMDGGEVGVE